VATEPPPFAADRSVLEDAETGFSVIAAPGFELSHDEVSGTYDLTSMERDLRVRYRRLPAVDPLEAALAFTEGGNLRFTLESQVSTPGFARVEAVDEYGGRWTVHAEHDELGTTRLVAARVGAAERTPEQQLDDQLVLETIRNSARGGPVLRAGPEVQPAERAAEPAEAAAAEPEVRLIDAAGRGTPGVEPEPAAPEPEPAAAEPAPAAAEPAAAPSDPLDAIIDMAKGTASRPRPAALEDRFQAGEALELREFQSADQTVTGKVPAGPGWTVEGAGGMLHADNPQQGELAMGFSQTYSLPNGMMQMAMRGFGVTSTTEVAPFKPAEQALIDHWLAMRNKFAPQLAFGGLEVTGRSHLTTTMAGSSGVFTVNFTRAGQPWRGTVSVATSLSAIEENWRCWFSSMTMPADAPQSVWFALLACWQAYKSTAPTETQTQRDIRDIAREGDKYVYGKLREINQGMRETYGLAPKPR
jgi:hypothetical protein